MHEFDYDAVAELRGRLIPYEKIEEFVKPAEGDVILDIGAGDGFYSVNFSRKIGKGHMISLEIDKRGAEIINKKIAEHGIKNIQVVVGDACSDLGLSGFNKVFFSNTFHDLDCRDGLLERLKNASSEKFEIIMIEFKKKREDFGPPEEKRFSEEDLKRTLASKGFRFANRIELPHHYVHRYFNQ